MPDEICTGLSEWTASLRDALSAEYEAGAPQVVTLATADSQGQPHARCVVCRQIDGAGRLYFVSDGRSTKHEQLDFEPSAEVVFWLARSRMQFRVRGLVDALGADAFDQDVRRQMWDGLSSASRALFFWPAPGQPCESNIGPFAEKVEANVAPPDHFEVLRLEPVQAERLVVSQHPHARTRWSGPTWEVAELNP